MTGVLWAVLAGVGFGLFQAVNRRAVLGMDVYLATFIQLLVATVVLVIVSLTTENLGLLATTPATAWLYFGLAGFVHFFLGWTFLNASQKKIGAARTTSLIGMLPLFGVVFAAVALGEIPTIFTVGGMLLIVGGVYLVNYSRLRSRAAVQTGQGLATGWRSLLTGLLAALSWSISPIFIRYGLLDLASPVLGLTFGLLISTVGYGLVLVARGLAASLSKVPTDFLVIKLIAGILSGLAMWVYWIAFDLAPVGLVLALSLLSVPVVFFLSPLLVGQDLEQVTGPVWLGSGLIITGSLVLIFIG